MNVRTVYVLVLSAVLVHMAQGQRCRPSMPCRRPCQLGLEWPSLCGICVCPPVCRLCRSQCYTKPAPGLCPGCAEARLCYR
uniref:Uncharacterized protein n=1 Tax=Rhipicephalus appendiculatus TaxID=34631 RepID=A0A131YEI2_RHIAP